MNVNAMLEVLKKTLKNTFSGKLSKWILGSFGSLLALLLFGKNVLNTPIEISIIIGISILGVLFIIRFILFLLRNSFKYLHELYRNSKYGEAIILLKEAFAKVHSFRQNENKSDELFMQTMVYLCDNLQSAFNEKNSSECSVSLKVPIKGALTEKTSVVNLCRDSEHTKIRDNANYKAIDHTIIGNTPFQKVLNKVLRNDPNGFFYLNNEIPDTKGYDNTSKELYPDGVLPYKSEIVVPIIPSERDHNRTYEALGFLCVDCVEKNKFDQKYDVPLIEGVADGIYDILFLNKNKNL